MHVNEYVASCAFHLNWGRKSPIIYFLWYNCKVILNIYTKSILSSAKFYMKLLTNSEDSWCVKMVTHNNMDSALDFNSQIYIHTHICTCIYIYVPCVWQLYENSLKNKDNTWDTKQPIFPNLASYYRENMSLMLHKYFQKFGMALTMHSLHWCFEASSVSGYHSALEELWPMFCLFMSCLL